MPEAIIRVPAATATPTATTAPPKNLPAPGNFRHLWGTTVGWNTVTGATGYQLRYGPPNRGRRYVTVSASASQYTIPDLDVGRSCEVEVQALGDGTS